MPKLPNKIEINEITQYEEQRGIVEFKKMNFELRKTTIDRLKRRKKAKLVASMAWFVDKAIERELNEVDRTEGLAIKVDKFMDNLSNVISSSVDNSDLAMQMKSFKNDLQPTLDFASLNSERAKANELLEFAEIKLICLHKIALDQEIPDRVLYSKAIQALLDLGYIEHEPSGHYVLLDQNIQLSQE